MGNFVVVLASLPRHIVQLAIFDLKVLLIFICVLMVDREKGRILAVFYL